MSRFGLGWPELFMLSLIALVLFGKRIPEVLDAIGRSVQEVFDRLQGLERPLQRRRDLDENHDSVLRTLLPALLIAFGVLVVAVLLDYLRA